MFRSTVLFFLAFFFTNTVHSSSPNANQLKHINQQVNLNYQNRLNLNQRYSHSAIAKYHLVQQQFPEARLMITQVQHVTPSGFEIEAHAVLTVITSDNIWVMDYELLNVYTIQDRKDLKPITSIEKSDQQIWIHKNADDWSIVTSELADEHTSTRLNDLFNSVRSQ